MCCRYSPKNTKKKKKKKKNSCYKVHKIEANSRHHQVTWSQAHYLKYIHSLNSNLLSYLVMVHFQSVQCWVLSARESYLISIRGGIWSSAWFPQVSFTPVAFSFSKVISLYRIINVHNLIYRCTCWGQLRLSVCINVKHLHSFFKYWFFKHSLFYHPVSWFYTDRVILELLYPSYKISQAYFSLIHFSS